MKRAIVLGLLVLLMAGVAGVSEAGTAMDPGVVTTLLAGFEVAELPEATRQQMLATSIVEKLCSGEALGEEERRLYEAVDPVCFALLVSIANAPQPLARDRVLTLVAAMAGEEKGSAARNAAFDALCKQLSIDVVRGDGQQAYALIDQNLMETWRTGESRLQPVLYSTLSVKDVLGSETMMRVLYRTANASFLYELQKIERGGLTGDAAEKAYAAVLTTHEKVTPFLVRETSAGTLPAPTAQAVKAGGGQGSQAHCVVATAQPVALASGGTWLRPTVTVVPTTAPTATAPPSTAAAPTVPPAFSVPASVLPELPDTWATWETIIVDEGTLRTYLRANVPEDVYDSLALNIRRDGLEHVQFGNTAGLIATTPGAYQVDYTMMVGGVRVTILEKTIAFVQKDYVQASGPETIRIFLDGETGVIGSFHYTTRLQTPPELSIEGPEGYAHLQAKAVAQPEQAAGYSDWRVDVSVTELLAAGEGRFALLVDEGALRFEFTLAVEAESLPLESLFDQQQLAHIPDTVFVGYEYFPMPMSEEALTQLAKDVRIELTEDVEGDCFAREDGERLRYVAVETGQARVRVRLRYANKEYTVIDKTVTALPATYSLLGLPFATLAKEEPRGTRGTPSQHTEPVAEAAQGAMLGGGVPQVRTPDGGEQDDALSVLDIISDAPQGMQMPTIALGGLEEALGIALVDFDW